MLPCQSQFFLLHVEGNRFGDFHFVVFYVCDRSVFFYSGKRIQVSFQTMFRQFLSDDRVVIPEDESIVRGLVLGNAEFSVDVILHTVVVAIKMVRSDVHQYGDVRTKVIHIIQLERAKFDNIIVMVIFGYLQSKTFADVACQTYVQTCAFENVVDQGSRCSLSVRTCNTDHFGISIASGKLNLGDHRCALSFQFQDDWGIIRDTGAFDNLVGIQNELFGMVSFFPGNMMAVEKFLIFVLDGGHVRNKRLKSFYFCEYGCTCAAFASS